MPTLTIGEVLLRLKICEPSALETGCWEYPRLNTRGYGEARMSRKAHVVHRVVYAHFVEPLTEDQQLHHRCRNRACANFEHLEPKTAAEHIKEEDGAATILANKTHCPHGHPYGPKDKRGRRVCRECKNSQRREKRQERNRMTGKKTRLERLQEACKAVGLYVATWSPGDHAVRYRFFEEPGNGYFGPKSGIFTALGWQEACTFARGRGAQV